MAIASYAPRPVRSGVIAPVASSTTKTPSSSASVADVAKTSHRPYLLKRWDVTSGKGRTCEGDSVGGDDSEDDGHAPPVDVRRELRCS